MNAVTLEGTHVRLEPLRPDHAAALWAVARDPALWEWSPTPIARRADLDAYVERAVEDAEAGVALPFATVDVASGAVVGSTRFGNWVPAHRRVEIGWTWIGRPWQRSAINTEAKLLMMRHAFETLRVNRVEWKTDALNARSRAAIARLGAREEGTLRAHMVTASGRLRDTVYFSVTFEEWPGVRDRLAARLAAG